MNKTSKLIVGLLVMGCLLFCGIQFWLIPANQAEQDAYEQRQTDALTHDMSVVEGYRSAYVGDASNVGGLFEALPLGQVDKRYAIDDEACALTVYYLEPVWSLGEEKVQRDLVYNTVAAMAAIDNLSAITYQFSDAAYTFDRQALEEILGAPLSALLEEAVWQKKVQTPLQSADFCQQFYPD